MLLIYFKWITCLYNLFWLTLFLPLGIFLILFPCNSIRYFLSFTRYIFSLLLFLEMCYVPPRFTSQNFETFSLVRLPTSLLVSGSVSYLHSISIFPKKVSPFLTPSFHYSSRWSRLTMQFWWSSAASKIMVMIFLVEIDAAPTKFGTPNLFPASGLPYLRSPTLYARKLPGSWRGSRLRCIQSDCECYPDEVPGQPLQGNRQRWDLRIAFEHIYHWVLRLRLLSDEPGPWKKPAPSNLVVADFLQYDSIPIPFVDNAGEPL